MSITVTRPEKVVAFCANLGLASEHERAVAALEDERKTAAGDPREVGSEALNAAAQRVRDLEQEMAAHTIAFTLRGLRRKRWVEFLEAHPARPDNAQDKAIGVDVSALDEVIAESIVSVKTRDGADVPFIPAQEWVDLADEMTNGQWGEFAQAVIDINHQVRSAPFSPLASVVIRRSEQTSKPPSD